MPQRDAYSSSRPEKRLHAVPGRGKFLVSTHLFLVASGLLFAEFYTLFKGFAQEAYYDREPAVWATNRTASWLGAASCVCWFLGFAVLIDWLVADVLPSYGYNRAALIGATIKLIAAVLFNVQPFSQLLDKNSSYLVPGAGVPWSNFVGICFFHAGNTWDLFHMTRGLPRNASLIATLPALGMFTYFVATCCLVVGDGIEYFDYGGTVWAPPHRPGPSVTPAARKWVCPLQLTGSALLFAGSLVYLEYGGGGLCVSARDAKHVVPKNSESGDAVGYVAVNDDAFDETAADHIVV